MINVLPMFAHMTSKPTALYIKQGAVQPLVMVFTPLMLLVHKTGCASNAAQAK